MMLSVVIPIFNEAIAIPYLLPALMPVLTELECEYEIVLVDDGSKDGSLAMLERLAAEDPRIKVFAFSRNFGHQAAITAGLDFAAGDAIVVMDADLQDPPEVLIEMMALYRQGYDVISAQRIKRDGDSMFKRWTARWFYRLMKALVDERLVEEVGDFRLFSRDALSAIRAFREQHRFMRGLVSWLGLREAIVPFERHNRVAGKTKYPLWRMLKFAWTAIASFSAMPLRLSMFLGFSLCAGGFVYLAFILVTAWRYHSVVAGWTSLVALQCIFSGVTLLSLGLVGDYVARIYEESKQRPLYILSKVVNTMVSAPAAGRAVVLPRCYAEAPHLQELDSLANSVGLGRRELVRGTHDVPAR